MKIRPLELVPITRPGQPARDVPCLGVIARQSLEATAQWYRSAGYHPPWIGYLAVEGECCVGTCAFKTPPESDAVEIAYFTFPEYEGRGIATRMATELLRIAHREAPRLTITAQTLPEMNASTAILKKLGFGFDGARMHPEDGTVWNWRLAPRNDGVG